MKKMVAGILALLLAASVAGCGADKTPHGDFDYISSEPAVSSSSSKPIQIVNTDNLTERESDFQKAKLYEKDDLAKSISSSTNKYSIYESSMLKSTLLIALQFDKDTPKEDVSAFRKTIESLSDVVGRSGYRLCTFYLLKNGDIRLETAPLEIKSGVLKSPKSLFHYSGDSEIDTAYADEAFG